MQLWRCSALASGGPSSLDSLTPCNFAATSNETVDWLWIKTSGLQTPAGREFIGMLKAPVAVCVRACVRVYFGGMSVEEARKQ